MEGTGFPGPRNGGGSDHYPDELQRLVLGRPTQTAVTLSLGHPGPFTSFGMNEYRFEEKSKIKYKITLFLKVPV